MTITRGGHVIDVLGDGHPRLRSFREGRYAEAVARYTRVLALKRDVAPSLFARGLARLRSGDVAGGRADLAAARKIHPKAGDIWADVGLHP